MESKPPKLGVGEMGGASIPTLYEAAKDIVLSWENLSRDGIALDVGAGRGHFVQTLLELFQHVAAIEFHPAPDDLTGRVDWRTGDLNQEWPMDAGSVDTLISLEVIEHVENPRFFFHQMRRLLRPCGRGLISMPNQLSWASIACLVMRDQFRFFQDGWYPNHIYSLLPIDLVRIAKENRLIDIQVHYVGGGRIPGTLKQWPWPFKGKRWSDSVFISFRAPAQAEHSRGML